MHACIHKNINKEIWVVMEILVQKSPRCILSGGVVACDIFLMGDQPYMTVCDRGGLNLVQKTVTYFLNGPRDIIGFPKLGAQNPYWGHLRDSRVVQLDSTGMISY